MFKLFSKNHLASLLALLVLNTISPSLMAQDYCCPSECNRFYIGGFGGGIYSNAPRLRQTGVAFFSEVNSIGPLAVDARGHSRRSSTGFGGAQIGYEWLQCPRYIGCSNWNITPAAELEAFFYRHTKKGDLINPTSQLDEHDFVDRFPMNVSVILANGVISLNNCCMGNFSPYIGGGIGAANLYIRKARSVQIAPPEVGVNHFDSKRNDSTWAFAAQAKAGLRYKICERLHLFGEYRFLFVDTSRFNFGSTVAPGHVPTTTWNADVKEMYYNAFAFGIQFDL